MDEQDLERLPEYERMLQKIKQRDGKKHQGMGVSGASLKSVILKMLKERSEEASKER